MPRQAGSCRLSQTLGVTNQPNEKPYVARLLSSVGRSLDLAFWNDCALSFVRLQVAFGERLGFHRFACRAGVSFPAVVGRS